MILIWNVLGYLYYYIILIYEIGIVGEIAFFGPKETETLTTPHLFGFVRKGWLLGILISKDLNFSVFLGVMKMSYPLNKMICFHIDKIHLSTFPNIS